MQAVLTIAGSDSGAAAGIQADVKTIAALGGYALTVVTAVTAQTATTVRCSFAVEELAVAAQFDAVFPSFDVAAAKSGMLVDATCVDIVARALRRRGPPHYVLDPVIASSSGDPLLDDTGVEVLRDELLPLATVVTPNVYEAERLSGRTIRTPADALEAGKAILDLGCAAVLVKGGHLQSEPATDVLVTGKGTRMFKGEFIPTPGVRGTGCAYSAAIATLLAQGKPLEAAIAAAKDYVAAGIRGAARLGLVDGISPMDHFPFHQRP